MAQVNWIQVVASLVGGGLAGTLLTIVVTSIRNRKQPVGYRTDFVPVFKRGNLSESNISATLTLFSPTGGLGQDIPTLYLVEIQLVNRGNSDLQSLEMGITFSDGDQAVHVIPVTMDRHHKFTLTSVPGPGNPLSELDFQLTPFNRKDSYKFTVYLVVPPTKDEPSKIKFSSGAPIVFKELPSLAEIAAQAITVGIGAGGIKLSLSK